MATLPSASRPSHQRSENGYTTSTKAPLLLATNGSSIIDRNPMAGSALDQSPSSQNASYQSYGKPNEELDPSQRGSSIIDGDRYNMKQTPSILSQGDHILPRRGGTLKKKASLRRSSSRRSSRAGSVRSLALQPEPSDEMHSAFYSPVPTAGNPTELLANRFTAWRKFLKDLVVYFREIQNGFDHRGKNILKIANVASNINAPSNFLQAGGINEAMHILRDYHKQAIIESGKARQIQEDVVHALTGLRSDLQQKIKEIKNLSGDFKNSVDKEMDATRRAVRALGDSLGQSDINTSQITGKQDPYLLRLAVERQLERQIDEENYLHQAYLNLEASGRELEAIVVGEIQKAYNAYTGILKRDADDTYTAIQNLRTGPISMPRDYEWNNFIESDEHFVDPRVPVRSVENIHYPGRDHELAQEVRAGLLERKSKYLKSYTAGWYVLSPTHLHEFKTADKSQAPIMSLYLPEQKLGSHSSEGGSSNKFMLKGRQTGSLHRGHSWVFRAESYDTMMAWYDDIKSLTESPPQERNAFVRSHNRSLSAASQRASSVSSDGVMDEEDEEPFSTVTNSAFVHVANKQENVKRPEPGGRFPSDIQFDPDRDLQLPLSPSSANSSLGNNKYRAEISTSSELPEIDIDEYYPEQLIKTRTSSRSQQDSLNRAKSSHATQLNKYAEEDEFNPYTYQPLGNSNPRDSSMTDKLDPVGEDFASHRRANQSLRTTSDPHLEILAVEKSRMEPMPGINRSSHKKSEQTEITMIIAPNPDQPPTFQETARLNVSNGPKTDASSLDLDHSPVLSTTTDLDTLSSVDHTSQTLSGTHGATDNSMAQHIDHSALKDSDEKANHSSAINTSQSVVAPYTGPCDCNYSGSIHLHIPGEFPSQVPEGQLSHLCI